MMPVTYSKISNRDQAKAGTWDVKVGQLGKSLELIAMVAVVLLTLHIRSSNINYQSCTGNESM